MRRSHIFQMDLELPVQMRMILLPLLPENIGIISVNHHTRFVWCRSSSPGPCAY